MPVTLTDAQRAAIRSSLDVIKEELAGLRSDIRAADTITLDHGEMAERVGAMDDVTLVFCMLGLLSDTEDSMGAFGRNANSRMVKRIAFGEIARRWIPDDVVARAFAELGFEDDDDGR
jgi:hypothetical protein